MSKINIINIKNINIIKNIFSSYKKSIIFGKGPTLKYIEKDDNKDTLFICINNSINYIKKCDLLVCNDIESFNQINLDNLSNCNNILIPYHIHINCRPNKNITYNNVISKINNFFTGNLIIYNLRTAPIKYNNFISLLSAITSVHTGFEFILKFAKNIKIINFYGFAKKSKNRDINLYINKKSEYKHFYNYKNYINWINIIVKKYKSNIKYTIN